MELRVRDVSKENYVIMRETPSGPIFISGTFTIKENAINECKKRIEYCKEHNDNINGWGEPYLVKVEVNLKKVEVK